MNYKNNKNKNYIMFFFIKFYLNLTYTNFNILLNI